MGSEQLRTTHGDPDGGRTCLYRTRGCLRAFGCRRAGRGLYVGLQDGPRRRRSRQVRRISIQQRNCMRRQPHLSERQWRVCEEYREQNRRWLNYHSSDVHGLETRHPSHHPNGDHQLSEREVCGSDGFLVKRYADIDVDTGGSAGWAGFQAYWDKTRYSVFSYNLDGDAPKDKRAHVVEMVAMPSDLALDDPFIGKLGSQQYNQRANINPVAPGTKIDADGVLQWHADRFLAGEILRINMYYDAFRSFAK